MCQNGWEYKIIAFSNSVKQLNCILLLLLTSPAQAVTCHPKINNQLPQYIIGYRSLIDEQSKKRTAPTAQESFPALIKGYERSGQHVVICLA